MISGGGDDDDENRNLLQKGEWEKESEGRPDSSNEWDRRG